MKAFNLLLMMILLCTSALAYDYNITALDTCYGDYKVRVVQQNDLSYTIIGASIIEDNNTLILNNSTLWKGYCNERTIIQMNIPEEISNKYDFTIEYFVDAEHTELGKRTEYKSNIKLDTHNYKKDSMSIGEMNMFIFVLVVIGVVGGVGLLVMFIIYKWAKKDD